MAEPTRVLILGGGFGGLYAALEFERFLRRRDDIKVTLLTRDNYFLFTPMLHEVAASDLDTNTIINPLRRLLDKVGSFVGIVTKIDLESRTVAVQHGLTGHGHELPYDHLVLALGSSTNFFDLPGVAESALTMKSLSDAVTLRNRLILHLEEANSECAAGERHPLLTFVIAGGGFAGVETIGGVNDFLRESMRFYPNLNERYLRLVLITPDSVILPELTPKLGAYAGRKLAKRGVEIITNERVTGFENGVVRLSDGRTIRANTLIWTAGTAPNPTVAALDLPKQAGRIAVDELLEVPSHPGVWALGDCAAVPNPLTGKFHPPTAQHALRQGRTLARNVVAAIRGGTRKPFRFSTLGQLAAIGRRTGVANIFGINFSGFVAWWLWRTIYLSKLPRFEKKLRVALDWSLDLVFAKDFAAVTAQMPSAGPRPGAEVASRAAPADSVARSPANR